MYFHLVTIDDVFGRIDRRVSDERKRVDSIKVRITDCKQLVAAVKGSNKATTVFSTSKFPAPKSLPLYPTIYSHLQEVLVFVCIMLASIYGKKLLSMYEYHVHTSVLFISLNISFPVIYISCESDA